MKVLILLTYYLPYRTGLTKHAVLLAENLQNAGFDVSVLCSKHHKKLKSNEILNNVNVTRSQAFFRVSRTQVSLKIFLDLIVHIKKADRIFIYLPYAEAVYAVLIAKFFYKKVYLVHNGDLLLPKGMLNYLIDKLYIFISRLAIRLSDKIIIHTKDYAGNSDVLSGFENKWEEILPFSKFVKASKNEVKKFAKKHNLTGKLVVGFSGRFVEEKGVEFLLRAVPFVVQKVPNTYFVLAGDYKVPYENYWKKVKDLIILYGDRITLLGLIEDERELASFYQSLDVLVLPSRKDCFPYSQIEAMMVGVPVVCTNIPGSRYMIQKTGMGVLVEKENPIKIAEGIVSVLKNRKRFVENRFKLVKILDNSKVLKKYLNLLN